MSFLEAQVPEDVVRIPLPTPWPIGPVNVYLLRGGPLTLIDAGPRSPDAVQALEVGLSSVGLAVSDIELLVLTHQHQDHIGNAAEVVRRSGAAVAAFAPLVDELSDLGSLLDRQHGYMALLMARHGMSAPEVRVLHDRQLDERRFAESVQVDTPLVDGDTLRAGARTFEVRHRPGHSPSDLIFVDADGDLLISGDHLLPHVSSNPLAHMPLGTHDIVAAADEAIRPRPLVDYLASLAQTARIDIGCSLPGHGPVFTGIPDLITARIALHEDRAAIILDALRERPRTARQLIDVLWERLPSDAMLLAVCEVMAHLDLLRERGSITSEIADGVVCNHPATARRAAA